MNYFYDVILNMDEDNCFEFYEWDNFDPIEVIKKIPLYRVDSETLKDFFLYKVNVSQEFLESIQDKTVVKNNKLNKTIKYACILCDTKNSLAIEFNEKGLVCCMSNLLLEDDSNLNEFIYSYKKKNISYEKIEKRKANKKLRQEDMIKKVIRLEINTLLDSNDLEKLKYLFYEWFSYLESDINKIKEKIKSELNKDIDSNMQHVYNIIKLSYNKA